MKNLKSHKTVLFTFFAATLLTACHNKAMDNSANFCSTPEMDVVIVRNAIKVGKFIGKLLVNNPQAPTVVPKIIATPATMLDLLTEHKEYFICAGLLLKVGYDAYKTLQSQQVEQPQSQSQPMHSRYPNQLIQESIQRFNATAQNRLLLHGPVGSGKSLAAAYIAEQLRAHKMFFEGYLLAEAMMSGNKNILPGIFDEARKIARTGQKVVICFDECECLALNRNYRPIDVHQFCHQIDLCINEPNIIIICITNKFDYLDTAFVRRFGSQTIEFFA